MPQTAMTVSEIEAHLVEAIAELGADPALVKREAELESLDVDSLDIVELGQMVDERYGVEIKAEQVKGVKTVGALFDVVIATIQQAG